MYCGHQSHEKALESVFDETEWNKSMLKDLFLTKIPATLMPSKDRAIHNILDIKKPSPG